MIDIDDRVEELLAQGLTLEEAFEEIDADFAWLNSQDKGNGEEG